jgi:small subunit ribosomal protein S3
LGVEKKFVEDGFTKALVHEYLSKELSRAGYGGMMMNRTPMGIQITVYAEKPGMVIGKGGKLIRKLTRDLDRNFRLDNPQIDVQDVGKAELNAQVVANRLASSLERGWYFRKAGQTTLRRVMDSGALGCEIVLSGKVTGPRSRVEKFLSGYVKHSGKPSQEIVDHGYAVAVKKLGTIGCQVRIVPPDAIPPDRFQIVPPAKETAEEVLPAEEKKDELEELLESGTEGAVEEIVVEDLEVEIIEEEVPSEEVAEEQAVEEPIAIDEEAPAETVVEEQAAEEPIAIDEEAPAETVAEEPAAEEPIAIDEEAPVETVVEEQAAEEPIATDEEAPVETVAEEQAAEEPIATDEEAPAETVAEEPAVEEEVPPEGEPKSEG